MLSTTYFVSEAGEKPSLIHRMYSLTEFMMKFIIKNSPAVLLFFCSRERWCDGKIFGLDFKMKAGQI